MASEHSAVTVKILGQMAVVAPQSGILDGVGKIRPGTGAHGSRPRFVATFQGEYAEGRNKGRSFEVSRNVRVGNIEPDAVPGPVFVDGGLQESEAAAYAFPACSRKCLGRSGARPGSGRLRGGGTNGRRGVVHRPLEKLERGSAGLCRLTFFRGEPAPRRKHDVRRGIGFFVHVNFMALGQRHAEFPLHRVFRIREQARAELAVFPGSREEAFCRVDGSLHRRLRRSAF